jgi:hypothetical protein
VLKVDLLDSSNQIIRVIITTVGSNVCFNASFVYVDNCPSTREALWAEIVNYSIIAWETILWILLGDFNGIRSLDEKCRGTTHGWASKMTSIIV